MLNATGIIFNRSRERVARLRLTRLCFIRMGQYKVSTDMIDETFKYGKEIEAGKLIYDYGGYLVGILCEVDQTQVSRGDLTSVRVIVITCWKRRHFKSDALRSRLERR